MAKSSLLTDKEIEQLAEIRLTQNMHKQMQAETEGGIVPTPLELINQMRQLNLETIRTRLEMLYKKYPETYKAVVKVLQTKDETIS